MIWIKWLLSVLGGLGVFLFGMRTLSDAIRRVSATSFREFLSSIAKHLGWHGDRDVCDGPSAVQLCGDGHLGEFGQWGTVDHSGISGVLLGANIGTTITAWLIVLNVGGFALSDMALPIAGLAVPMLSWSAESRAKLGTF